MELQKCEKCKYAISISKYWENEFKQKKATIIMETVAITLAIMSTIINTILLFKK